MGFHWPSHVGLDEFWTGDGQFADAFFFAQKVTLWQGDGIHENPRCIGRKRIGPDAPWNASRVEPMRQACAYDDDSDPDFHGHR